MIHRRQINPEELEALYHDIGKGIWHLQYVEDALSTLLALKVDVKTPGQVNHAEAVKLLAKHRRNTLGTSLRIAKENSALAADLQARLTQFKDERDWLVHRSQNTHGELLYTEVGRAETFNRVASFVSEAQALQQAIINEVASFAQSHGVNTAEAEANAHAKIAKLKGET